MRYHSIILLLIVSTTTTHAQSADRSLVASVEQAIVDQTNRFRQEHDLLPVHENEELVATATEFANFMAQSGKYGHHADGRTPAERAKSHDYQYCVVRENIAYRTNRGQVSAESLVEEFTQGWIDSPPHRENMLADYVTETGVAVATTDDVTYYAVQLFGRPKSKAIKLQVTNVSGENQTLVVVANDSEDKVELPPRVVITMTRCYPTTIRLADSDSEMKLTKSAEITITREGLTR